MKDYKKSNSFGGKYAGRTPGQGAHVSDARRAESHKTKCDGCQALCEVPFIPNGKKPVYCRNCYKGKDTTTSFTGQPFTAPVESKFDEGSADMKKQFAILNTKLDRLISAIEAQTRALSGRE